MTPEDKDQASQDVDRACEEVLARRQTLENATEDAYVFQRRVLDFVLSWNDWDSPDLFETALRRETLLARGSLFAPDLQEYEIKISRHNNLVVAALGDLNIASNLLRVSTGATDVDWSTLRPTQQQQVDRNGIAHIADLIYSVKSLATDEERDYAFFFEHKSENDPFIAVQLIEYVALYLKYQAVNAKREKKGLKKLVCPIPVVIGCYDRAGVRPKKLREVCSYPPNLEKCVPDFDIIFFDVQAVDVGALDVGPMTKALLKDLQFGKNPKLKDSDILDVFGDLRGYKLDSASYQMLTALIGYWNKACHTWNRTPMMGEYQRLALEMKNERIVKEVTPILDMDYYESAVQRFGDKWDREKSEEWLAKGEARGEIKGEVKNSLRAIRRSLTNRFPNFTISPRCDKELQLIDDLDKLDAILDFCYVASSLEQVEAFIEGKYFE